MFYVKEHLSSKIKAWMKIDMSILLQPFKNLDQNRTEYQ